MSSSLLLLMLGGLLSSAVASPAQSLEARVVGQQKVGIVADWNSPKSVVANFKNNFTFAYACHLHRRAVRPIHTP